MDNLYVKRVLSEGYPDLERLGVEYFHEHLQDRTTARATMELIGRLIDLTRGSRAVLVIGCGPKPTSLRELLELGFDATGIEPLEGSVIAAQQYLGDTTRVTRGTAERVDLPDVSQRVVLMESVLEHVDSVALALAEAYRVLAPGGILYVATTNRFRLGRNDEFRLHFFQFLPDLLKECYVFHQLHYAPELANYSPRPAVHWFSFAELCRIGRQAGFAQFYSPLDLLSQDSQAITRSAVRRHFGRLLPIVQRSPWFRALALMHLGHAIFMWKRPVTC